LHRERRRFPALQGHGAAELLDHDGPPVLGSGPHAVKYAKRILSPPLTFGAAHLSTFKFEKPLLDIGKALASRIEKRAPR
jgi:hypothetical protein